MLNILGKRVFLACGKTDMRKNIDGLLAIVERSFKLDPFDGSIFVFCNKNRDRIKVLEFDTDGFWLHLKRLECGHFRWPGLDGIGEEGTMELSGDELATLLSGTRLELKLKRNQLNVNRAI